ARGVSMKAIVQDRYGNPEAVLSLQEIAKPAVKDGEALVRVHAASIHVGDWLVVTGVPYIARPAYGKPKGRVPGTDIAGTVEAVGNGVTGLRPGDEVFGWCTGAFAEYASAPADHFVPKPTSLTFEQAAAVGVSASTALQLLRDQGKIKPGQKVLINGASGGIGTVLKSATVSMFERRQLGPAIKFTNRADLLVLKELIEAGKITPVIDATYALSDTGRGLAHVGEGHARGTVVISV